jgi:NitT/TauT family transport system substrate-binding protein
MLIRNKKIVEPPVREFPPIIPTVSVASCLLFLAFAVLIVLSGCDRLPARKPARRWKNAVVAVTTWPADAALYVARDKGFFTGERLDAAFLPNVSGHLGLDALLSGEADFATAGETPIARAAVEGRRVAVIATISEIDHAIVIIARRDRGISTPYDLKGKRVGLVTGTTAEFYLDIYLTTSRIDPKRVHVVNLAPEKLVEALASGEVDAASTWEPHTSALRERLGDNCLVMEEPGLYTMTWNLVTTGELVLRDPDAIQRFLRAIVRANRFIDAHPAEARAITARNCGMALPLADALWDNFSFGAALNQSLILYLEDQARWMLGREGGRLAQPNFLEFIYTGGLKTVHPESVGVVD